MLARSGKTWSQQPYDKVPTAGWGDQFGNTTLILADRQWIRVPTAGWGDQFGNSVRVGGRQQDPRGGCAPGVQRGNWYRRATRATALLGAGAVDGLHSF